MSHPGDELKYDANGLIVAIAQDEITGEVRMVAWMNDDSLARTIETGKATFYSRSRQHQWSKGESSGNVLWGGSLHADCDRDTLLLRVSATGPSCHTGRPTCFFQSWRGDAWEEDEARFGSFLQTLESEIDARASSATSESSYTKHLLEGGSPRVEEKIREEAGELCTALAGESQERVASETADLLYHVLVGLKLRDVSWREVIEVLAKRSGVSGHAEKADRTQSQT